MSLFGYIGGCVIGFLLGACVAMATSTPHDHHGIDEICRAFPADSYPRPLTYTVRLPDGQPLATGGCQ